MNRTLLLLAATLLAPQAEPKPSSRFKVVRFKENPTPAPKAGPR